MKKIRIYLILLFLIPALIILLLTSFLIFKYTKVLIPLYFEENQPQLKQEGLISPNEIDIILEKLKKFRIIQ